MRCDDSLRRTRKGTLAPYKKEKKLVPRGREGRKRVGYDGPHMAAETLRDDARQASNGSKGTTALARRDSSVEARTAALEVVRASGFGLLRGKILVPTPRIVAIVRQGLANVKVVESFEIVPADGEARMHLVLQMMGNAQRVVVRLAVASFHLHDKGGALRLRLLESPTFAGKHGGKGGGLLGMIGAFGEAALTSMGPEKIVATVAEFLGKPLKAKDDMLIIDIGQIPSLKKALARETVIGKIGDIVNVTGARFRPGGLEITVQLRPRTVFGSLRKSLFG